MIDDRITLELPAPWSQERFHIDQIGPVNYLVGPNGSGKTRFASELLKTLSSRPGGARLLGTDRLMGMANPGRFGSYFGDSFSSGYAKNHFGPLREAGTEGSGIDTIVLLEERIDLRIRIEAILGQLFSRDVAFEWDSGNLVPMAVRRDGGGSYRLDRDECHGIKELVVLLTHLYDDRHRYLIIDEPELNLHPQYQAFLMQEVRRVGGISGEPGSMKIMFLITHSPFIIDFRSKDDILSVISFDLAYGVPRQIASTVAPEVSSALHIKGRLNAHHKQLFFSDRPIFVEGHHDVRILEALMETAGISAASAGSCIIDCGGAEEVNHYLRLCQALDKEAHFVYDLDSLFKGQLRSCIKGDNSITSFLLSAGVGTDFGRYVGELDRKLTQLIDLIQDGTLGDNLAELGNLTSRIGKQRDTWNQSELATARVTMMTALDLYRDEFASIVRCNRGAREVIEDVEGRWKRVLEILSRRNIHVLPGGTVERYLPCFEGDRLKPSPYTKGKAIDAELEELQAMEEPTEEELAVRYGDLYTIVKALPSAEPVDLDSVLRRYLSDYVHGLQKAVYSNPTWERLQIEDHMNHNPLGKSGIVSLKSIQRSEGDRFEAVIVVMDLSGEEARDLRVRADTTIANMPDLRPTTVEVL